MSEFLRKLCVEGMMVSEIQIKLSQETLLEILKQAPPEELEAMTKELEASASPLQHQLERACARVRPVSVESSPFFSLPSVDIGPTSAGELDQMMAEEAYRLRSDKEAEYRGRDFF